MRRTRHPHMYTCVRIPDHDCLTTEYNYIKINKPFRCAFNFIEWAASYSFPAREVLAELLLWDRSRN